MKKIKKKYLIVCDEEYPVYGYLKSPEGVEISDGKIKCIKKMWKEYNKVQGFLENLYRKQEKQKEENLSKTLNEEG